MADNTTLNAGAGGDVISTDDVGAGLKVQRVKVQFGADGSAADVTTANPLPVIGAANSGVDIGDVTVNNAAGAPVPVQPSDGSAVQTFAALDLDSGAGTVERIAVGLAVPGAGGPVAVPGDATNGLKVQVAAALPAGTNAIGKLAANDGVDIGNVDVASIAAGDNNIGNVDIASALPAGDNNIGNVDVVSLPNEGQQTMLNSISVAIASDQSAVPIADGGGSITVDAASLPLPTGAATEATLSALNTKVPASPAATADVQAVRDRLPAALAAGGGLQVEGVAGGVAVPVSGTFWQATQPVSTASLPLPTGAATEATLAAASAKLPAALVGGRLDVVVGAALPAGTNNIGDVDVLSLPASTNTLEVVGDVAHDAAAAGNPVLVAGVAQNVDDTAPPNRVSAEGDATRLATDWDGSVFAHPHGPQVWSYHFDGSTAQTDTEVHAAAGVGLCLYVTDVVFSSGAATAINLFFEEGSTKKLGPYYLEAVAGRGMGLHFQTPKKLTANTALTMTTSAAIAHSVDVTGFVAP